MPLTMPTCLTPPGVLSWPMTSTGINACSARGWLPVSSFHFSFSVPTFCLVRIFSSLTQPERSMSAPSVV